MAARSYTFKVVKASTTSGKYSDIMIQDCAKVGMKPVCDHPSYCKTDSKAVYIGQSHHVAYPGHRHNGGCAATSSSIAQACGASACGVSAGTDAQAAGQKMSPMQ